MKFKDLRDFLNYLESIGQLVRIKQEISSVLEVTELHRKVLHSGGPALLLENVRTENGKSSYPMLVNLFGSKQRAALGLGLKSVEELKSLGEKIAFLRQPTPPEGIKEAFGMIPLLKDLIQMKPKTIKKAACQEVVLRDDEVDLDVLPIQTCWPNEPAPLITWPLVVTKDFNTEKYNVGIYRMQKLSKDKCIMRWLDHRGGADHFRSWKRAGKDKMPVAAVIGTDPGTIMAAVTPVPEQLSEYEFAGLIRKSKLELVECVTQPLLVPANAEIVIEGYVSTSEKIHEGPYGDHTGYYNSVEEFPAFYVTAITMRKDPIYLSTYTGRPPDEPSVLGEALNDVFVPLLKQQIPEVVDFYLPPEGCSYRIGVVSIKKAYPGHARKVMMGIWSALRQFMYTKFLIVVDEGINIRSWDDVMWAVSTKMDFARDVVTITDTPIDYLDFASPKEGLGAKIGFDATDKIGSETDRQWGEAISMDKSVEEKIAKEFDWLLNKNKSA